MSKRNEWVALQQIMVHAQRACEMAKGKKRSDLDHEEMFQLALTRLLEIVGEAARRVPLNFRKKPLPFPGLK
mgnify:CR=1 FL=1